MVTTTGPKPSAISPASGSGASESDAHHDNHGEQVATMHVNPDRNSCLEVAVLRGDAAMVRELAKRIVAERGVTHGEVSFMPAWVNAASHAHGGATHKHAHTHPKI